MNKKLLFFALFFAIIAVNNVFPQQVIRELPYYLDSKYTEKLPENIHHKSSLYKATPLPADAYKNVKPPQRLLGSNGIELIPMTSNGHQSETWIAVNPNNPNIVVAGSNDYRYNHMGVGYKMGASFSTDGGITWGESLTPRNEGFWIDRPASGGMTNFDPGIAFDDANNVYYCYGFAQTSGDSEADNGVFVVRSTNGGASWDDYISPVAMEINGTTNQAFHDRYMIVGDSHSQNDQLRGNLYVVWKRFKQNAGIVFSRISREDYANDKGWTVPTLIPGGEGNSQSPTPVVGRNGEVYVTWQDRDYSTNYTKAIVQKSTDGGLSWWPGAKIAQQIRTIGTTIENSGRNGLPDKQKIRQSSYPSIAVDASDGQYSGNLYVVQTGKDENNRHVLAFTRSMDGGTSWTPTKRIDINDPEETRGFDVFMPACAVDPVTGLLSVIYYTSYHDIDNNQGVDAYVAISGDGGETFVNLRLSPETIFIDGSNDVSYQGEGNWYWGDYTSITSYNGRIFPCFWLPSTPYGNFNSVVMYTSNISPNPQPPTQLDIENSYLTPSVVTITWTDPTNNNLGMALTGFKINVYRNGEKIAEVDKGIQTYEDTGLEDGVQYNYTLRAVTTEGLESEDAHIGIFTGGGLVPNAPTDLSFVAEANGILLSWLNPLEHTDGSFNHDLNNIKVYIDGEYHSSIEGIALEAGETSSASVELNPQKFYHVSLTAVSKRGETMTESQISEELLVYAGAPISDFAENFDDPDNLIPHYTDKWGITDAKASVGQYSMTDSPDGDYENLEFNRLIFAPFKVTAGKTSLSFDHIANISTQADDYALVSVSTDMKDWTSIASFDMASSPENFTGDLETSNFVDAHRDLSAYLDQDIYVAFILSSNAFKEEDGWYIDNLRNDGDPNSTEELITAAGLTAGFYPNPAAQISELKINMPVNGELMIKVYDILGNVVIDKGIKMLDAGIYTVPMTVDDLANGTYYCHISARGATKTIPLIINK